MHIQDQRFQGVITTVDTVSHLFSQPLTVIMGHVDLLTMKTHEEHTKYTLSIIKEQLDRISKYMSHLRVMDEYKTVDFHGLTMLDMGLADLGE